MKHRLSLLAVLVMIVVFGARWFGPSDIYDNDQPKTVAYTVDMVRHGRWVLPVDMLGRPATKPPMYNWIGAPVVAAGWHSEFALKVPSVLAAFVVVGLTWYMSRWTAQRIVNAYEHRDPGSPLFKAGFVDDFAALACICVLVNYSMVKLSYTARPDMVLTAFLTAGWVLATGLLAKENPGKHTGRRLLMQLGLWLCVAGAALTKGPPALLLLIYVILGGKMLTGRWSLMLRSGIVWGLPLALLLFGWWAYLAYLADPEHFRQVFLGDETLNRVGRGGVTGIVTGLFNMPAQMIAKFLPWSLFALMGMWHVFMTRGRLHWFTGPKGPAMLWVILIVIFFSLSGGKRADYLAPAYPAAAVLAAFWLTCEGHRLLNMRAWQPALAGLVVALMFGAFGWFWSAAAVDGYGNHLVSFADRVEQKTRGLSIHFENTRYTPIQALLGYNQPPDSSDADTDTHWLIRPWDNDASRISSDPIWSGKRADVRFALYPNGQQETESR